MKWEVKSITIDNISRWFSTNTSVCIIQALLIKRPESKIGWQYSNTHYSRVCCI